MRSIVLGRDDLDVVQVGGLDQSLRTLRVANDERPRYDHMTFTRFVGNGPDPQSDIDRNGDQEQQKQYIQKAPRGPGACLG